MGRGMVLKFVAHGRFVQRIAARHGWLSGARYTNLRDVRGVKRLGFLDIDWKNYDFRAHLAAAALSRPLITVARDIEDQRHLPRILDEAVALAEHATHVVLVPKALSLRLQIDRLPARYVLGYSVPTRYGATALPPEAFAGRPVHLLGGRPDRQRELGHRLNVVSLDCNRFTLDARFGDFFDGTRFRPHPVGGYRRCLRESIQNIDLIWASYTVKRALAR